MMMMMLGRVSAGVLFVSCLVLGVACTNEEDLGHRSTSADGGSVSDGGAFDCPAKRYVKCTTRDEKESEIDTCKMVLAGPCGEAYRDLRVCEQEHETCRSDGKPDLEALRTACEAKDDIFMTCQNMQFHGDAGR